MFNRRKFMQGLAAAFIAPKLPLSTPLAIDEFPLEFLTPEDTPHTKAGWYRYTTYGVGVLDNRRILKADM